MNAYPPWRSSPLPTSGTFLVWLDKPHFGSHVAVMRAGRIKMINGHFHFDVAGKPTHWMPEPVGPDA